MKAEELPCTCTGRNLEASGVVVIHGDLCPAYYRPIVTAALQAKDDHAANLRDTLNAVRDQRDEADARIAALEARIAKLSRCLLPIWMSMCEGELCGETIPDEAVILNFIGSGTSDQVTAGEIRAALAQEQEI